MDGSGEGDSFADMVARLHREEGPALVRHAERLLRRAGIAWSRLSAEDVVQDAIVTVLVNHGKGRQIENVGGYVYRVIEGRVRDEAKRVGVADPVDVEASAEGAKALWVSSVEDVEGRLDVEAALGRMSPQQRKMIGLTMGAGYSQVEVAEMTGVHRGTVARHVMRAAQALSAALAALVAVVGSAALGVRLAGGEGGSSAGGALSVVWDWMTGWGHWPLTVAIAVGSSTAGVSLLVAFEQARQRWSKALRDMVTANEQMLVDGRTGNRVPDVTDYAESLGYPAKRLRRVLYLGCLPPYEEPGYAVGEQPAEESSTVLESHPLLLVLPWSFPGIPSRIVTGVRVRRWWFNRLITISKDQLNDSDSRWSGLSVRDSNPIA
ncbi:sigma-70 family RNA polymerase sigma factor [Streptomyces sp. NPDC058745]|uniref:sigma-70 family RNA polymerase sigma factor n=1 Tax=Streptomyces sp. NPDC058745 TaxID=3346621 RepID=UPI0036D03ABE